LGEFTRGREWGGSEGGEVMRSKGGNRKESRRGRYDQARALSSPEGGDRSGASRNLNKGSAESLKKDVRMRKSMTPASKGKGRSVTYNWGRREKKMVVRKMESGQESSLEVS